jgi:hypothetical protein
MSFYLVLQPPSGGLPLDLEDVDRVLRAIPNVVARRGLDGVEYVYQNPDTGVHFSFDVQGVGHNGQVIAGAKPTLSFDINLARPSFFALEAMPIVAAVADSLQLLIIDPQNDDVTPWAPLHVVTADLMRSWEQSNRWAIEVLRSRQGAALTYYSRDKATYYWAWAYFRAEIERKYAGRDVFVPRILTLRRHGRRRLITAIKWPERAKAVLIPTVDFIFLTRDGRGRSGRSGEGLVMRHSLLHALNFGLQRVADPIPHWHYSDHRGSRARRLAALAQLSLKSVEGLQAVSVDGFVDVQTSADPLPREQLSALLSLN